MSGEDYYNKLSNYSDIELLKEYCYENGLEESDPENQLRIENEREEVIDELVADYVRMMKNTGRFQRGGYPTGRAWTREHYHDNEDEDYEVDPKSRVVKARNRKYGIGGYLEGQFVRKGSDTGKGINEGYVVQDQDLIFETEEGLLKHLRTLNWIDADGNRSQEVEDDDELLEYFYNEDYYYWTQWDTQFIPAEIREQGYYFTQDGEMIEISARGGYPTGRAWTREHYHDNDDEDYEVDPLKRKVKARNRKYELGGTAEEETFIYEDVEVPESRTVIYADELDEFIDEWNDTMETNYVDWEDFNAGEEYYRIMPLSKFKGGGTLIGNQYKIDMNKNGRIDAEDFKILRSTMNGAWRNEHKHVNHSEDWETRYAKRNNSSRTGYKGRKEYGGGGGVETYSLSDFPIYAYYSGQVRFVRNPKKDRGKGENKQYALSLMQNGKIIKYEELYFDNEKSANTWVIKLNKLQEENMTPENKKLAHDWVAENDDRISELIRDEMYEWTLSDFKWYVKNQQKKKFGGGGGVESTKLTGKGSRAKNTYNKEVDAYKWFVVSDANDIDSGWEYKSDAQDQANEFNEGDGYQGKKWKVMSLVTLKKKNLADPRENWKYKAEFGALLLGAGVGAVLGNEIAKSGIKGTASKIQSRIKDDYADFKQASQKKKIDKFETGGKPKVVPYKDLSTIKPDFVNDVKKKVTVPEITLKKTGEVIEFEGLNKRIQSSLDVDKMLRKMWNTDLMGVQEEAYVIFLNQANKPIGYYHHSTGAINLTVMDVEIVSAMAIKSLSKGVIIAHNHPSGEKKPSVADINMTKNMKTALELFNIELVDHMIITKDSYYSFLDNGAL